MNNFDSFLNSYTCHGITLTIDDFLFFLNLHYKTKFHSETTALQYSQKVTYPRNILIDYGQSNEVINEVSTTKLQNLFKLCAYGYISVHLRDLRICKEMKEILVNDYSIRDNDGKVWIVQKRFKYAFLDKIFGPKMYTPPIGRYYINNFLDIHLEAFLISIKIGTDFDMQVYDTCEFTGKLLNFITTLQDEKTKRKQNLSLYEEISSRIGKSLNFGGQITLSYPIDDYAKTKGFYFDTLYGLHTRYKLNMKEVYIREMYVTFVIEKIVNFDKADFLEPDRPHSGNIARSTFDPIAGTLTIRGKDFKIGGSSKIHDVLNLLYTVYDLTGNPVITFEQIGTEYVANKAKYKNLASKDLNYEGIRDILRNRCKKIKQELELDDETIGITTSALTLNY